MAPTRKVAENAEHPERDPEVEVVIVENERQHDTKQRADLAKSAAEHKSRLHAARILIDNGATDVLVTENKGKNKDRYRRRREKCDHERILAEVRLRKIKSEK